MTSSIFSVSPKESFLFGEVDLLASNGKRWQSPHARMEECRAEHAARKFANTLYDPFKDDKETDLKQTTNMIFPTT